MLHIYIYTHVYLRISIRPWVARGVRGVRSGCSTTQRLLNVPIWDFPKIRGTLRVRVWSLGFRDFPEARVPYFGVLIIRILLFRVLY